LVDYLNNCLEQSPKMKNLPTHRGAFRLNLSICNFKFKCEHSVILIKIAQHFCSYILFFIENFHSYPKSHFWENFAN